MKNGLEKKRKKKKKKKKKGLDLGAGELSVSFKDVALSPLGPLSTRGRLARALNPARGNQCSEDNRTERKKQSGKITPQKGEWVLYKAFD